MTSNSIQITENCVPSITLETASSVQRLAPATQQLLQYTREVHIYNIICKIKYIINCKICLIALVIRIHY
jgi:hypothetical protein